MKRERWHFLGTHEAAIAALEEATGVGSGEPLLLTLGPKQLVISFAVFEQRQQLPYAQGLTVFTRKVTIQADLPATHGFRKSLDGYSQQGLLDAAERIARQVEAALATEPPSLEYEKEQMGADVGYRAAMMDDFYSGILPFDVVVDADKAIVEGNNAGSTGGKLVYKDGGREVGSLTVKIFATEHQIDEVGTLRENATVVAKLSLSGVDRGDAELMDRAMRSWIRGKALSDRLPLDLPTGPGVGLQE